MVNICTVSLVFVTGDMKVVSCQPTSLQSDEVQGDTAAGNVVSQPCEITEYCCRSLLSLNQQCVNRRCQFHVSGTVSHISPTCLPETFYRLVLFCSMEVLTVKR